MSQSVCSSTLTLRVLLLIALAVHISVFFVASHTGLAATVSLWPNLPRNEQLMLRWQGNDHFRCMSFVRPNTPPDSLIVLPPQASGFDEIGNAGLTD